MTVGGRTGLPRNVTRLNDFIGLGALFCHFFCKAKPVVLRRREAASKDASAGASDVTHWVILRDAKLRFAPQDEVRGIRRHYEVPPECSHFAPRNEAFRRTPRKPLKSL
jgi:hypothetical protein